MLKPQRRLVGARSRGDGQGNGDNGKNTITNIEGRGKPMKEGKCVGEDIGALDRINKNLGGKIERVLGKTRIKTKYRLGWGEWEGCKRS